MGRIIRLKCENNDYDETFYIGVGINGDPASTDKDAPVPPGDISDPSNPPACPVCNRQLQIIHQGFWD